MTEMEYSVSVEQSEAIKLLRALRGAPLSCMVALYMTYPKPQGRAALVDMTRYGRDEITRAMNLLVNIYQLAARVTRFEGWCLTANGYQMRLPFFSALFAESSPRALSEGEKIAFDASSSSSFIDSSVLNSELKTTTTPEREGEKIALDPLPEGLAGFLASDFLLGCPQTMAEKAVRAALENQWTPRQIECELTQWILYVESPLGRGIDLPPARFACAKVQKGEQCHEFFHHENPDDARSGKLWIRWRNRNDKRIRRAEELLRTYHSEE